MSNKRKKSNKTTLLKFGCLPFIFMILPVCACGFLFFGDSISQSVPIPGIIATYLPPTPIPTPTPMPEPGKVARELLFSGKVVNHDESTWLNDRLVVVYLNGQEVGRTITKVGESELSEEGVTDGYFEIPIPNTYEVPENRFDFSEFDVKTDRGTTLLIISEQEIWFGDMAEGGLYELPVPTKNLSYYIKIFATTSAYLPPEMLEKGSTFLTEDKEIILALGAGDGDISSDSRILIQGIKYNVSQEIVEINKEIIPIDNCKGNSPVLQAISSTQTFYHQYKTETTATTGIELPIPAVWPNVLLELQVQYGFEQGQVNSKEVASNVEAQPGTNVMYTITWLETWESGTAVVEAGTDLIEVPFRVRKSVTYETDSEAFNCS